MKLRQKLYKEFGREGKGIYIPDDEIDYIVDLFLKSLPKESHINYHEENGMTYLDQNDIAISLEWEKGFNSCLSQIREKLK